MPLQIIDVGQMVICPYAILSELEEVGEAGHGEDLIDVGVHTGDDDAATFCLGILEDIEENTQTAGGDVFQFVAIEHDAHVLTLIERLQIFLGLCGDCGVESTFETGDEFAIFLLDGGCHIEGFKGLRV